MDKVTKRYLIPLGVLFIGSFLMGLLNRFFPSIINGPVYYLLFTILLFSFGMTLNTSKTRLKNYSLRHIVIVVLLILLYLFESQLINVRLYSLMLSYLVYPKILVSVFYVYLGWLFSER